MLSNIPSWHLGLAAKDSLCSEPIKPERLRTMLSRVYLRQAALLMLALSRCVDGYDDEYNSHYMEDWCGAGQPGNQTMNLEVGSSSHSLYGYVKVVRSGGYPQAMNCVLTVIAPPGYHLTVRIRRIEIYRDSGCGPEYEEDSDYLEITGEEASLYYCGTWTPDASLNSLERKFSFRFYSFERLEGLDHDRVGFDLYYTAFHRDGCDSGEFKCDWERRCIPDEVTCDDYDNCGDWSDEHRSTCGMSTAGIVCLSIMAAFFVLAIIVGIVFWYKDRKKKKEQQRIRETQEQNDALRARAASPTSGARNTAAANATAPATISYTTVTALPLLGHEQYPPPYQYQVGYNVSPETGGDAYQQQRLSGYGQISYPGADYYNQYSSQAPDIPPPAYDNQAYTTSVTTVASLPNNPAAPEASTAPPGATQVSDTATTVPPGTETQYNAYSITD